MDIPVNADVYCEDRLAGRSSYVIINPTSQKVTHIVIKSKEWPFEERLVSTELISESTPGMIRLQCTEDDLENFEPFVETEYIQEGEPFEDFAEGEYYLWPSYVFSQESVVPLHHEHTHSGEVAVHRGARVIATDGAIGKIDEFLTDPQSNRVTHLVLKEDHLWGKMVITIPFAKIDRIEEEAVHLNINKRAVELLPHVPLLM